MVSLFLTVIAVIAIYRSYVAIRVGMEITEQQAEIHQNLRIGVQRMVRELRMATFDPEGSAEAGFTTADDTVVAFTCDLNDDGVTDASDVDPNDSFSDESVTYTWADTDADGNPDSLRRTDNNDGTAATIITNVSGLKFVYLTDDDLDSDGFPDLLTKPLSAFELEKIRNIEIILVARATNSDGNYTNNRTYSSTRDEDASGTNDVVFQGTGDNFRRGRLVARVKARNAGLN